MYDTGTEDCKLFSKNAGPVNTITVTTQTSDMRE
jgi:hypothetical protein